MAARPYRTLGDLRSELRSLLGFGASGAASGANQTLIDAHLRNAQTLLYYTHDWAHLRKYETLTLGAAAYLLDYPVTANPDRVQALSVYRGGVWSKPLDKGISPQLYTYQNNPSWPQRWEPYEQIQIWPLSDAIYSIRCFFINKLLAFTSDGDRATIDDTLVLLIALWTTKAHYRQPDAAIHQKNGEALLTKLKAKSWGQSKFNPNDFTNETPMVRPVVV